MVCGSMMNRKKSDFLFESSNFLTNLMAILLVVPIEKFLFWNCKSKSFLKEINRIYSIFFEIEFYLSNFEIRTNHRTHEVVFSSKIFPKHGLSNEINAMNCYIFDRFFIFVTVLTLLL